MSDEIILMAREAGFEVNFDIWAVSVDGVHINKELERFFRAAYEAGAAHALANIDPSKFMSYQEGFEAGRLAEREACVKACEDLRGFHKNEREHFAAAIRARGEK
jgi:hypothetical protein